MTENEREAFLAAEQRAGALPTPRGWSFDGVEIETWTGRASRAPTTQVRVAAYYTTGQGGVRRSISISEYDVSVVVALEALAAKLADPAVRVPWHRPPRKVMF